MILKLLPISLIQCMLLSGGQVLMKYGLTKAGDFSWSWQYFGRPGLLVLSSPMATISLSS